MILHKPARDEIPKTRAPLLLGLAVALVCAGAGVASAQEVTTTDEATGVPAAPDPSQEVAPDDGTAGETTGETSDVPAPDAGDEATEPAPDTAGTTADGDGDRRSKRSSRDLRLILEDTAPRQVYFIGRRHAKFAYKFEGARRADLRVEILKVSNGDLVRRYRQPNVRSGTKIVQEWNGRRPNGHRVRKGNFYFRVQTKEGKALNRKRASGQRNFRVRPAIFPVRGKHDYWDGWGAGRGHQGQDVGAACGTELEAAEAGEVAFKGYDGGGYGYYVVINPRGQNHAEVYAHLKRAAKVRQGSRVMTGERIGFVGATGNASGCHLHFEYWDGRWPGGNPTGKATKKLKSWDGWS